MQYYTGDSMKVLGEIQDLTVAYKDQHVEGLSLVVILGQRPCLMGPKLAGENPTPVA